MTFEALVPQVLDLLQRQGWASFRTLRRRFQVDRATLAQLQQVLLAAHPVTVDETGSRLVWQGELRPAATSTPTRDVVPAAPSMAGAAPWPLTGDMRQRLSPLVGRAQEVALLQARWAQVQAGQGQVVALSGEAGIGKSRLVQVVSAHVADTPHGLWACRGAPTAHYSAFAPVIDLLQQVLHYQPDDSPAAKLHKLETTVAPYSLLLPEAVSLFAALLSVPLDDRYPPLTLTPERQRQRTLETILMVLLGLAAPQPGLLIVEDLHWVDPSTLELLRLLVAQVATARLYILLTWRPEFQPPWPLSPHQTTLTLGRLLPPQVEQLATHVAGGKTLPPAVLAQIVAKTEGVPLFVEELTKMVLAAGWLRERQDHYELIGPLPPLAMPPTMHDSITARLEQLGGAKAVAQVGAVWGRGFTEAQLQAVASLDRRQVAQALAQLAAADMLREVSIPPRMAYVFKHALIQEAAHASLPLEQRQQVHRQVAQVLEAQFPETVATQPELLAHHYTEAGLTEQAIPYWQRAGQQALQRSANPEAVQHLTTGLRLLATLPETPARAQQELDLQIALGPALMATRGYAAPEVEQTYARARTLCMQVGEPPQLFPTLQGLCAFYQSRGTLPTAREFGEQLDWLAQRQADPTHRLEAHDALGQILFFLGDYAAARTHCEQGIALTDLTAQRALALRHGVAPGITCLGYAANTLWCLGYPAQAVRRNHEALTLAQKLEHAYSLAWTQHFAAYLHHRCREVSAVQAQAGALLTLATAQEFPLWVGFATYWRGWALSMQGQAGLAQMHQGLAAVLATGQTLARPFCLVLLAEAAGHAGQVEEGLRLLDEALAAFETSRRGDMLAEAYRLQGELLLCQAIPDAAHAEACFQQALTIARRQQAKSWELRAATSLSRLWQRQGKRAEARELLAPVYGWFTEGFDTADLQEAKALLAELA